MGRGFDSRWSHSFSLALNNTPSFSSRNELSFTLPLNLNNRYDYILDLCRRKETQGAFQMNFIRKIFEGKTDDLVHKQFTRYGKGNYENKALVEITKKKDSAKFKTTFEFSGELALALAESIQGTTRVTGGIITTKNIEKEIGFPIAGKKQFAGVKTFLLDLDLTKEQIFNLFKKFPQNLILLSFKTSQGELKSKVKSPTSAKPGKGAEEGAKLKIDFCTFSTKNLDIVKDFVFETKEDFKKAILSHTFQINTLNVPKEYENDFEQARFYAKRSGKILRKVVLDGKEIKSEKEFEA